MPLIPWRPLDLDRFFEDDDWFLPVIPKTKLFEPAMNLYETDKEVIAELNLPNIDPEKVQVTVENQVLHVTGTTEEKKEEKKKGYWRKEIRSGSFERAVQLPVPVKEEKTEASYEKGVLKVVMPKQSEPKKKAIKVKVRGK